MTLGLTQTRLQRRSNWYNTRQLRRGVGERWWRYLPDPRRRAARTVPRTPSAGRPGAAWAAVDLRGEDERAYAELLARVQAAVRPKDILEEFWVRDVVDLLWETLRLRRMRASVVTVATRDALEEILAPIVDRDGSGDADRFDLDLVFKKTPAQKPAASWYRREGKAVEEVEQVLREADLSMDVVAAVALPQVAGRRRAHRAHDRQRRGAPQRGAARGGPPPRRLRRGPAPERRERSGRGVHGGGAAVTGVGRDRPPLRPARLAANQRNALRSTGPKSVAGKRRAARNALKHGLAVPLGADPNLLGRIEALSRLIAGEGASASRLALARRVAEAQVDLDRVRAARFALFSHGVGVGHGTRQGCDRARQTRARRLRPPLGSDRAGEARCRCRSVRGYLSPTRRGRWAQCCTTWRGFSRASSATRRARCRGGDRPSGPWTRSR